MRILARTLGIVCLQCAFQCSVHATVASAGTVKIEQQADRSITVTVEDSTIAEVVGKLGETYGFRLDQKGARLADATRDEAHSVDGRYQGSLRAVLDRLLTKESYFIEHVRESRSGIARVVIYNTAPSSAASQTTTRVMPVIVRPAQEPEKAAVVAERYRQSTPLTPPAVVAPIRRVQPAQPPAVPVVRPNSVAPSSAPVKVQAGPGQTNGSR